MPAIIDSAPDCVTRNEGGENFAEDGADFILQDNYQDCAGFGTFMPGSTYGEDGSGAETIYMILTWLGIAVTLLVLICWVVYENRKLIGHVGRFSLGPTVGGGAQPGTEGPPPQPGGVGDTR
jgi:hypothetical protein